MTTPKIIALAGSLRKDSFHQKLINEAARFALESGAEVEVIKLADLAIPMFDEDLEAQGTPAGVQQLKDNCAQPMAFCWPAQNIMALLPPC